MEPGQFSLELLMMQLMIGCILRNPKGTSKTSSTSSGLTFMPKGVVTLATTGITQKACSRQMRIEIAEQLDMTLIKTDLFSRLAQCSSGGVLVAAFDHASRKGDLA